MFPSACAIAAAVRAGERTAVDVAREHLDRIAARDGELNAFQAVRAAAALADAAAVDAHPDRAGLPLAGVPVAVKDNTAVAGLELRHGSAATSAEPATSDDELVTRLRAAGAVVVGSTRMPELAAWGFTASRAYGSTRNPLDPALDPGGSSGGAAAAVAAGMAAVAVGSDGGGSIRIPAAACGLVGVKPSAGLVPLPGGAAQHWCGLSVAGPIARTVADAAALLAVLAGDPHLAAPLAAPLDVDGPLRVARSVRSPALPARPEPEQVAALDVATARLRSLGHTVATADPPYPATLAQLWQRRWWAGIATDVDVLGLDPARLEARTRAMVRRGRRVLRFGGPRPAAAAAWRERATAWFADHDVLLTPAVARGPGPAGALADRGYLATSLASARALPYTPAWNLAGFPAIVVPVGRRSPVPLCVQLVAPVGAERLLLAVAAALEAS
ncbi:MAG: amidase family protein [Pseudonocardia sp.]